MLVESLLYCYDSLNIIGPSLSPPAFHFRLELYNFTPTANEKDKKCLYLLKRLDNSRISGFLDDFDVIIDFIINFYIKKGTSLSPTPTSLSIS